MRAALPIVLGISGLAAFSTLALAQASKSPPRPATGQTVRYIYLYQGFMGDLPVDGILREVRQGARLVSATLDLCHDVAPGGRKDRFVAELKPSGPRLTGSAVSQEEKLAVTVTLTRTPAADGVSFEGTIRRGAVETKVATESLSDVSEEDHRAAEASSDVLQTDPKDFTEVMPDALLVRVKREAVVEVLKRLRADKVLVRSEDLTEGCVNLRTGERTLTLTVDPMRAEGVVGRLRGTPGVIEVGWTTSAYYNIDYAVRVPAAGWMRPDGTLDRGAIAPAVSAAVAKSLSASAEAPRWDDTTGELKLKFRRPYQKAPGLDLSEIVEIDCVVAPEAPRSREAAVVWIGSLATTIVDEGDGPRLKFTDPETSAEEDTADADAALVEAVARELKGRVWDTDNARWK